jgi:N-terminal acetyltransferase B complex non-catalytic subunit
MKCLRYNLHESEITAQLESARALEYTSAYLDGLTLGLNLPEAEYQPADDLASLAAHAFVNVANLTKTQEPLYAAVSLLEYGLTRSKESFNIHLALIRLYHLLCASFASHAHSILMIFIGAPSLALEHYRALSVKQVQTDTLSHLILARASAFSLAAMGDITLMTEIVEASQIYISNSQDVNIPCHVLGESALIGLS